MTHNTGQWIKVEDGLPEDGQAVWCLGRGWENADPAPAKYFVFFDTAFDGYTGVTHWMPMQVPAPPEDE